MHASPQFFFQSPQLSLPPLAHRLAQYREVPLPSFPAAVRKTQEVERSRFAIAPISPILFRIAAKLDDSRLVGMQLEAEPRESLAQFCQKPLCLLPSFSTSSASRSTCRLRDRASISRLNTRPVRPPVNASAPPSRAAPHDSGPLRFAKPSTYETFIHNTLPVLTGARRTDEPTLEYLLACRLRDPLALGGVSQYTEHVDGGRPGKCL